jgi:beta-phosphoglucomutase-like phosphatase (HAD superfamily)
MPLPVALNRVETELDTVADDWQFALDAAGRALDASERTFPAEQLHARRRLLAQERLETEHDLAALAAGIGARRRPWLSPFPLHPALLGVSETTRACIFDLDGVLTDSGVLHAAAWAEVLDDVLLRLTEPTGWHFIPFDRVADYAAYIDGRPRLEGIRLFLRSRGIQLSDEEEGELARRKSDALGLRLSERGVNAVGGARVYLEAAGRARLERAVVSSSTRTLPMLELAGLAGLVEARVDAEQIAEGGLRSRPAPDILLRACELLGVEPEAAVSFAHTADGVSAARTAGLRVVGVSADERERDRLLAFGAEQVAPALAALLDRRVAAAAA